MKSKLTFAGEVILSPGRPNAENPILAIFLESLEPHWAFTDVLPLVHPFPSAEQLALELWECLTVELSNRLAYPHIHEVTLPHMGKIFWYEKEQRVDFLPTEELLEDAKQNKPRLRDFIEGWSFLKPGRAFNKSVGDLEELIASGCLGSAGDDLLQVVGRLVLEQRMKTDKKLKRSFGAIQDGKFYYTEDLIKLYEVLCLALHDAICAVIPVDLTSIGTFKDARTFIPDQILTDTVKAMLRFPSKPGMPRWSKVGPRVQ